MNELHRNNSTAAFMDYKPSNSRRPSRPVLDTQVGRGVANTAFVVTPPETPTTTAAKQESGYEVHDEALFHNYLRAIYPFKPESHDDSESTLMTASIKPGDLILVHSIHANGWADGTVLNSGDRGWLPTNYCEPYDHPYLRNLLNAMTQFWDLLGASEDANLSTFVRQDYIRGLIAGVRHLLEHADCLHRDADVVQRHTGVRRMRKGLLADLSTLVQIAKRLQETIGESYAGEVIHVLLDDLITKAFKVVTRAVGFADVWTLETSNDRVEVYSAMEPKSATSPNAKLTLEISPATSHGVTPTDSAKAFPSSPGTICEPNNVADSETSQQKPRPLSSAFRSRKGSVAHRMSLIEKKQKPSGMLASARLAKVHDVCISYIGAFIGHHLHSRSASELVEMTDRLVETCESMLTIVDEVYSHDFKKTASVFHARLELKSRLEELVQSTQDLFRASESEEDQIIVLPEQSNHLVMVATELIRTAGDCVVKTRSVIEHIGDFELENFQSLSNDASNSGSEDPPSTESEKPRRQSRVVSTAGSLSNQRISMMHFPPPPPPMSDRNVVKSNPEVIDFAANLIASPIEVDSPITPFSAASEKALPPIPSEKRVSNPPRISSIAVASSESLRTPPNRTSPNGSSRKDSSGLSIAGSTETINSSVRLSSVTVASETSTRATTPDQAEKPSALLTSFASIDSLQSEGNDDDADAEVESTESQLLQRTYANELTINKDGQVTGGSLAALVEQLTTHDTAPDAQFLSAFYVTFRAFTTPVELARALFNRFDYIGESKTVGIPVRLRIYNAIKGWLETYWNIEADKEALPEIRHFAQNKLRDHLPTAGDRLLELTNKVAAAYESGAAIGPLVSGVGKIGISIHMHHREGTNAPPPAITPKQINLLRNTMSGTATCSIVDFEPLELARQFTIVASKIFCEIQSEEFLSLEWNKKGSQRAINIRRMCSLNTDLAHIVGDTVLAPEDAKKRAMVIKHWAKVAMCCLELSNYESLMAIMCSLNSSVVQRLKRTWDLVSKNTKNRLEELNAVVDFSKNHASLRRRLENPIAPCLPFLGICLTDLTFVDAGNPKTRELPGSTTSDGAVLSVVNFDRHMRTAKIIAHVQKFQVPYNLSLVPELQAWIDAHMERMRASESEMISTFHRRSLMVEPRVETPSAPPPSSNASARNSARASSGSRASSLLGFSPTEEPTTESRPRGMSVVSINTVADPEETPPTPAITTPPTQSTKFAFLRTNTFGFKMMASTPEVHTLEAVPEVEK